MLHDVTDAAFRFAGLAERRCARLRRKAQKVTGAVGKRRLVEHFQQTIAHRKRFSVAGSDFVRRAPR